MKIPKAEQLPSGSWRTRISIGGKRISFVRPTEEEAVNAALLAMLSKSTDAKADAVKKITVSEAIDGFLADMSNVLSPSTIRSYRAMQKYRFASVMDRQLSSDINWQAIINEEKTVHVIKRSGTREIDTGRAVSAKTIKNSWSLISTVLTYYKLPVPEVKLPKVMPKEHTFLDPDQIKVFLKAIEGHRNELAYLLLIHGLRRSEMASVTKEDIITIKGKQYIRVSGARVFDENNKLIDKAENKTTASVRLVPIVIPRLLELTNDAKGLLFQGNINSLLHPLNTVLRHNGLPEVGLHGLRHSYASLCYFLDIPMMVTQKWGGWDDPTVVMKIYTHLANQAEKESHLKMVSFFSVSMDGIHDQS